MLILVAGVEQIVREIIKIEDEIEALTNRMYPSEVLSKIKSGALLNKLKQTIKSQKLNWEVEFPKYFKNSLKRDIGEKTSRCDRMKVAKIIDSKEYAFLGWDKLKLIASNIDVNKKSNSIKDFFIKYNIDSKNFAKLTGRQARQSVNFAILNHRLKFEKVKISNETIQRIVDREIKIEKKDIDDFKIGNPEEKAILLIDYSYRHKYKTKNTDEKFDLGNLENDGLLFFSKLKKACKDPESTWVELATLDDIAHMVGKLFALKSKEYR